MAQNYEELKLNYEKLKKEEKRNHLETLLFTVSNQEQVSNNTMFDYITKLRDFIKNNVSESPTLEEVTNLRFRFTSKCRLVIIDTGKDTDVDLS